MCSQTAQISTLAQGKNKKSLKKCYKIKKKWFENYPSFCFMYATMLSIWITRVVTIHPSSSWGSRTDDKDNHKNWNLEMAYWTSENPPKEVILSPLILYVNVCTHKCLSVCEPVRGCSKSLSVRSMIQKGRHVTDLTFHLFLLGASVTMTNLSFLMLFY